MKQLLFFILVFLIFQGCGEVTTSTGSNEQSSVAGVSEVSEMETMSSLSWKEYYYWTFNGLTTIDTEDNFYTAYERSTTNLDITLSKVNATGAILWSKDIPLDLDGYSISNFDDGKIVLDKEGNVYITASVYQNSKEEGGNLNVNDSEKAFVMKISATGEKLWQYVHSADYGAFGTSLAIDENGMVYSVGTEYKTFGIDSTFLVKLSTDGQEMGYYSYDAHSYSTKKQDLLLSNGSLYLLCGHEKTYSSHRLSDIKVSKIDLEGEVVWSQVYEQALNENMTLVGLVKDAEGNLIIGSTITDFSDMSTLQSDLYLMKISPSTKQKLWEYRYGTDEGDFMTSMATDNQNNIFIAGFTHGTFNGFTNAIDRDAFLSKLSFDGNLLKTEQFGTDSGASGKFVGVNSHNELFFAGYGDIDNKQEYSFLMKY